MAELNTDLIFKAQQPNLANSYMAGTQQGIDLLKAQAQAPLINDTAQTELAQAKANLAGTQLGNQQSEQALQSGDINLQAQKRANDYAVFARGYKIPINDEGNIDINKVITDHVNAGFPDMALRAGEDYAQHQLNTTKSSTQRATAINDTTKAMINGVSLLPPDRQPAAIEAIRQSIVKTTGVDPAKSFGPDWVKVVQNNQLSPTEQLERIKLGATVQGTDPSSDLSKMIRDSYRAQGVQVPEGASAFDIINRPELRNQTDQLPSNVKTAMLNDLQNRQSNLDGVDSILRRVESNNTLNERVKVAGSILGAINRFANTPEAAQLQQLVADLKTYGIEVDEKTTLAGAREKLESEKVKLNAQTKRIRESVGQNTITGAARTSSTPMTPTTQAPARIAGGAVYMTPKGPRALTPEQAARAEAAGWKRMQ